MQAKRKLSKHPTKPKAPVPPTKKTDEQAHRQRFDQLLDDAVLGVPPPKKR